MEADLTIFDNLLAWIDIVPRFGGRRSGAGCKTRRVKVELVGVLRGQKVLVFSYFKDTAIYLRDSICADQAWRVSAGDGRGGADWYRSRVGTPPRGGEIEVNKPGDAERWLLEQLRFDRVSVWSDSPDWSQVVAVAQREGLATILLAQAPEHSRCRRTCVTNWKRFGSTRASTTHCC